MDKVETPLKVQQLRVSWIAFMFGQYRVPECTFAASGWLLSVRWAVDICSNKGIVITVVLCVKLHKAVENLALYFLLKAKKCIKIKCIPKKFTITWCDKCFSRCLQLRVFWLLANRNSWWSFKWKLSRCLIKLLAPQDDGLLVVLIVKCFHARLLMHTTSSSHAVRSWSRGNCGMEYGLVTVCLFSTVTSKWCSRLCWGEMDRIGQLKPYGLAFLWILAMG